MGKIVKGIVAVGLIVAGAVTGNPALIAAGFSMGASLLAPKPKAPKTSPANADRLFASIDLRTPRKIVFGHTAMATDIRDQEYTDSQGYFHRFIVTAAHEVDSYEEIWFDDKKAWTAAGGVQGEYVGYLTVATRTAGSAANAINISARMGTARRFTGLAYIHLKYKLTGSNSNTESPFAQSIPTRVTIRGKGALIYDVRKDSTVPGGSGSHRADDQTTWEWDDDAARNPALQTLWYLLGWRIQNPSTSEWKLSVGKGIPPERIDLESFIDAANLCDESVTLAVGGTEPRYRSDGIFSEGDDPTLVLDNLKAAMNAELDDVDGKIRLTVLHNDLGSPQPALTTADVLGDAEWVPGPSLEDSYNVIRGGYTDAGDVSLYQLVDYPEVRLDSVDGIDRVLPVNLPLVQSASQAQRLVKQRLQRIQYGGTFRAEFDATAWRYIKNDVVPFSFAPLGWTEKLFRVADTDVKTNGRVAMLLAVESPAFYAWDADETAPVEPAAPTTYDFTLNPVVQDIGDALTPVSQLIRTASVKVAGDLLTAADTGGGTASITVATHDWDYPGDDADVTRTGDTITGLSNSTLYHAYFDDATLANGTPTYAVTTSFVAAVNSTTNPYRHYLGAITTPAGGGGGTTGGGDAGTFCPVADTMFLRTRRGDVMAGAVVPGDMVWGRHEETGAWDWYRVEAVRIEQAGCLAVRIDGETYETSASHKFDVAGDLTWTTAGEIGGKLIGSRAVAAITVEGAHTYLLLPHAGAAEGVLSHNKLVSTI